MRVVNRFQKIAGFDRSMALASSALTAMIPLMIIIGAVLGTFFHDEDVAGRIIQRYGLSGEGADSVKALFSPAGDTGTSVGVFGALFLIVSALSFARATQRLFEQTWELKPLSVRNSRNGLWWIFSLGVYLTIGGWLHSVLGQSTLGLTAALCDLPVTIVFLLWSGRLLTARRVSRAELLPFVVTASLVAGLYSVGASVYLPRLFNSYATRYGSVGAVFAMISGLFGAMFVIVASAALGREVADELVRISQGQRPSESEVRRQWDNVVEQSRSRWRTARDHMSHRHDDAPHG